MQKITADSVIEPLNVINQSDITLMVDESLSNENLMLTELIKSNTILNSLVDHFKGVLDTTEVISNTVVNEEIDTDEKTELDEEYNEINKSFNEKQAKSDTEMLGQVDKTNMMLDNFMFYFKDTVMDSLNAIGQKGKNAVNWTKKAVSNEIQSTKDIKEQDTDGFTFGGLVGNLALTLPWVLKKLNEFGEYMGNVAADVFGLNDKADITKKHFEEWDKSFAKSIEMQKEAGGYFEDYLNTGNEESHQKAIKTSKRSLLKMEANSDVITFGQEGDGNKYEDWEGAFTESLSLPQLFSKQLQYIADHFDEFKNDDEIEAYYNKEVEKMEDSGYKGFDADMEANRMFADWVEHVKVKKANIDLSSEDETEKRLYYALKKKNGSLTDKQQKGLKEVNKRIDATKSDAYDVMKDMFGLDAGTINNNTTNNVKEINTMDKSVETKKIENIKNIDRSVDNTKTVNTNSENKTEHKTTIINQGSTVVSLDKQEIFGDSSGR